MTTWSFASSPLLILLGAAVWAGAAWLCWQNATRRGGKAAAFMEALRLVIMTLLVFTLSLDEFVIAFFTDGPSTPTLPIIIYSMVRFGVTPEINALASLLLVVSFTAILSAQRLTRLADSL